MLELIEIYWHGLAFGIGTKTNLQKKTHNQGEFVDENKKKRNLLGLRDEIHRRSFDSKILLSIDRATFSTKTANCEFETMKDERFFGSVESKSINSFSEFWKKVLGSNNLLAR